MGGRYTHIIMERKNSAHNAHLADDNVRYAGKVLKNDDEIESRKKEARSNKKEDRQLLAKHNVRVKM